MKSMKKSFYISPQNEKLLEEMAAKTGRSQTEIINDAICHYAHRDNKIREMAEAVLNESRGLLVQENRKMMEDLIKNQNLYVESMVREQNKFLIKSFREIVK